ncbi:MAG: cytochrome [Ramlibacter sp.]|nr:cytochrome [Ramlibacter sp.]
MTTTPHARWRAAGIALAACIAAQWPVHAATPGAPAQLTTCVACHGAQGEGSATGVPRLAGQNAQYLEHALSMFKAGTRTSPIMQPVASGLSDAEMHDLAGYFSGLHGTRVPAAAPPAADLVRAGEELARVGAIADPTPPCFSCHRPAGPSDNARFPSLAGQHDDFVVNRLHEFQARARAKAPDPATMTAVAAQLNETQIRQVAAYLSTLPPP